jgi:uncharacterized protein (DUF697 family)
MTTPIAEPRSQEVTRIVNRTSIITMAIAAVLSPIPMADEIAFIPVYGIMATRIGKKHGLAVRDIPWRPVGTTIFAALGARAAINVTVSFIPGVAAVANAISAGSITQIVGAYIDSACENPSAARPLAFREIADVIKDRLRSRIPRV